MVDFINYFNPDIVFFWIKIFVGVSIFLTIIGILQFCYELGKQIEEQKKIS